MVINCVGWVYMDGIKARNHAKFKKKSKNKK